MFYIEKPQVFFVVGGVSCYPTIPIFLGEIDHAKTQSFSPHFGGIFLVKSTGLLCVCVCVGDLLLMVQKSG